jgi:hypothetical protein
MIVLNKGYQKLNPNPHGTALPNGVDARGFVRLNFLRRVPRLTEEKEWTDGTAHGRSPHFLSFSALCQ